LVDERLVNGSGTSIERLKHGYDRVGNRLYRENVLDPARGELCASSTWDQLLESEWENLYGYYQFRREEFLRHYHKLSNVESTFTMINAKFGEAVRARTESPCDTKRSAKSPGVRLADWPVRYCESRPTSTLCDRTNKVELRWNPSERAGRSLNG